MKYFALMYEVVDRFAEKRMPHRAAHLALVRGAQARGELVMAGALGDPPDGALLVFRGESPDVAERFARADPYVLQGLATRWQVRPWNVVVGVDAK
jgi:uncharacterized protein YciI